MSDEAERYTAEHTVMDANLEIRELKHLLVVKDKKIKELEQKIEKLKGPNPYDDVDYGVADESEDEFTEQLSFSFKQE